MKDRAEFIQDISVKGMFYALTVRSPIARGRLKEIVCPKLPNSSYSLITAAQIPGKNELAGFSAPILADKNLSYIGQPIAILTGPDQSRLADIASRIVVDAEEETPVFAASSAPEDLIVKRDIVFGNPILPAGPPPDAPSEALPGEVPVPKEPPSLLEQTVPKEPPAPSQDEPPRTEESRSPESPAGRTETGAEPPRENPAEARQSAGSQGPDQKPGAPLPDAAPAKTERRIGGTYIAGMQEHWYAEACAAVAELSSANPLHKTQAKAKKSENSGAPKEAEETAIAIYTATQWPFHVKRSVAALLGLDGGRVHIRPTRLSVHLDGKIWYPSLVACHAALAAWITGHSVKLALTREEDFLYSPKRNRAEIGISSVLGEKGEILSSAIQLALDLGAHGIFEDEIMDHSCLGALGAYRHRSFTISGAGLRSNIPPQGPMAGFGLSQGFFAAERHISRIADSLGMDPAEMRKNNFLGKDRKLAIGTALKNPMPLAELIDAAAAMSDYYRKWASYELLRSRRREKKWDFLEEPLRGIGIATAYQGNGFLYNDKGNGNCAVEMTLEKDGSLEINTSLAASGIGFLDTWRSMAEETLGIDPAQLRLKKTGAEPPDAGPGTLSRNVGVLTKLAESCLATIRKQRARAPLPITVKRAARHGKEPGWVPGKYIDPDAFARPSWGAAVTEIEIDPVSLEPLIRGVWLAVDGGKILSQRRARGTLVTGIIQALGWTCREKIRYEQGKIPEEIYRNCDIASPAEVPPIHVDFIWNDKADPKGIGDLPFCCVPAAYVQAVSQAMDHCFERIPLDAQDIWDAAKQKETENAP